MNASVNCAPQKDTIDQPQGAESIIVPILFGIIFVVGFIANLVVILRRNFILSRSVFKILYNLPLIQYLDSKIN